MMKSKIHRATITGADLHYVGSITLDRALMTLADIPDDAQLRARAAVSQVTLTGGALRPNDHRALRWVTAEELTSLPWVPADRAWLGELAAALRSGRP